MDLKKTAWTYAVGGVAAVVLGTVLLEGPISTQLDKKERHLIENRLPADQDSLTEDKVRAIVKEEMQPLRQVQTQQQQLQHKPEEIRSMLGSPKPQAPRKAPAPQ